MDIRRTKLKGLYRSLAVVVLAVFAVSCGDSSSSQSSSGDGVRSITVEDQKKSSAASGSETTSGDKDTGAGPVEVEARVISTGLEVPWDLAFLPDGKTLVTERDSGRILTVDASGNTEEVDPLPESGSGEGGLLGLTPSPDYENDRYLYAYYSTGEENRVVRFRLGEKPELLLGGIPVNTYHDGGRISFSPDGLLYVATGDAGVSENAQDLSSLSGKILRLTPRAASRKTTRSRTTQFIPTVTATFRVSPGTKAVDSTPLSLARTLTTRSTG